MTTTAPNDEFLDLVHKFEARVNENNRVMLSPEAVLKEHSDVVAGMKMYRGRDVIPPHSKFVVRVDSLQLGSIRLLENGNSKLNPWNGAALRVGLLGETSCRSSVMKCAVARRENDSQETMGNPCHPSDDLTIGTHFLCDNKTPVVFVETPSLEKLLSRPNTSMNDASLLSEFYNQFTVEFCHVLLRFANGPLNPSQMLIAAQHQQEAFATPSRTVLFMHVLRGWTAKHVLEVKYPETVAAHFQGKFISDNQDCHVECTNGTTTVTHLFIVEVNGANNDYNLHTHQVLQKKLSEAHQVLQKKLSEAKISSATANTSIDKILKEPLLSACNAVMQFSAAPDSTMAPQKKVGISFDADKKEFTLNNATVQMMKSTVAPTSVFVHYVRDKTENHNKRAVVVFSVLQIFFAPGEKPEDLITVKNEAGGTLVQCEVKYAADAISELRGWESGEPSSTSESSALKAPVFSSVDRTSPRFLSKIIPAEKFHWNGKNVDTTWEKREGVIRVVLHA